MSVVRASQKGGLSLIEIILSLGIMGVVLATLGNIVSRGYQHYYRSLGNLDVQRAALTLNRRLTEELSQSNMGTIQVAENAIGFATPTDSEGYVQYDHAANVRWTSRVCYHVKKEKKRSLVVRKRDDIGAAVRNPTKPEIDEVHSVQWFRLQSGGEIVGRDIVEFRCEPKGDLIEIHVTGSVQSRGEFEMTIHNQVFPRN